MPVFATMKAHIEIRVRLNPNNGDTLHDVLSRFARKTKGWKYPVRQSKDYERRHGSQAGFAVCDSVEGLERAAVALANLDPRHPSRFRVTNIIPRSCSSLTLDQYNAIGLAFARQFASWLRTTRFGGTVKTVGPSKALVDIIPGEKSRKLFEAWLHSPTPLSHPSDLYVLDCFICHLFRHPGAVRTYELESYLVQDRDWKPGTARFVVARIETGLELLRVDRKF
jgi:hypothetical protein